MTDKEIIKANHCCVNDVSCSSCPYFIDVDKSECKQMREDTLDLIHRQQAEITAVTEKLNATIAGQETLQKHMLTVETEAIKEFAERLKEHLKGNGGLYCVTTMNAQIDTLVEEMVGKK